MSRSPRGRRVLLVCLQCEEIFSRRTVDARRSPRPYCSRSCFASSIRTGRTVVQVACSGCQAVLLRAPWNIRNQRDHYCTRPCYEAHVDRAALGRRAAAAPNRLQASPIARFLRSQKAGLARARNLSAARRREISMLAVKARLERGATRGPFSKNPRPRRKSGFGWYGPVLLRARADGELK